MGVVLTQAMTHVITESISDYYEASEEGRLACADRMAGAISAVLYIAQAESVPRHIAETKQGADQDADQDTEQPQGGAELKRHSTKKVTLDMGKVRALRDAGWSTPQIAEEMRVSVSTVARRLSESEEEAE